MDLIDLSYQSVRQRVLWVIIKLWYRYLGFCSGIVGFLFINSLNIMCVGLFRYFIAFRIADKDFVFFSIHIRIFRITNDMFSDWQFNWKKEKRKLRRFDLSIVEYRKLWRGQSNWVEFFYFHIFHYLTNKTGSTATWERHYCSRTVN